MINLFYYALGIWGVAILSGCGKEAPQAGMSAPAVSVMPVSLKDIPYVPNFVGQVTGSKEVEVRAQVSGVLLARKYQEGQAVQAGDVLFQIDPAPFQVSLDQANAQLAQAEANLNVARLSRNRTRSLFAQHAVSKKENDSAVSAYQVAKANVEAAQAAVHQARINLGYCQVVAPLSGTTSKAVLSEGNLVSTAGLLTTISQLQPIYVNFSYSSSEALQLQQRVAADQLSIPDDPQIKVSLRLADGSDYPKPGRLNFSGKTIDEKTGTVQMRAVFDNESGDLLPGQFVRVYLYGMAWKAAVLIPQRAIVQMPEGKVVYVLDKDNKVTARPVVLGQEIENNVIVHAGLQSGDRVVVEGVLKARPGQPVQILPASPA